MTVIIISYISVCMCDYVRIDIINLNIINNYIQCILFTIYNV